MLLTTSWLIDVLVLLCSICCFIYMYSTRRFDYWKRKNVPYKKPVPIFGNMSEIFLSRKAFAVVFGDLYSQMKSSYLGIFILDQPALIIKDLDLIKRMLIKDFEYFKDRSNANREGDLGGDLLFLMKNPEWKPYRREMTVSFSSGKMRTMYSVINETGIQFVKYLFNYTKGNDGINAKSVCIAYGTELIVSAAFGLKGFCFENENSEFRKAADNIFNSNSYWRQISIASYMFFPSIVHLLRLNLLDPKSERFFKDMFWKNVNFRKTNGIKRNDIVGKLMEMRENKTLRDVVQMSDDKLVAISITFFLGGIETISNTVTYAFYELAKRPEVQKKLRDEINRVVKNSESETFTYDMISHEMTYLRLVLKETLRKYPGLVVVDRQCKRNYEIPGKNIVIDKGTTVFIPILALHMDPAYFPNPEEFIPERFAVENLSKIKPFTYLPFGDGPRNCVGERFAILACLSAIAHVIYNFEVEMCEKSVKKIEFQPGSPTLAPKSLELFLRFKAI